MRVLTPADRDEALALCARNPAANCFVASRLDEGALNSPNTGLLGFDAGGQLEALLWTGVNLVPVEATPDAIAEFAHRVRRQRRQCASIFGPRDQVAGLWSELSPMWGPARTIRHVQPLMATSIPPSQLGMPCDSRVRLATAADVDLVVPAAAAMFTDEIGYPPFAGSTTAYRSTISALIRAQRTYVWVEDGRCLFKADVGSVGVGAAQIQGVWLLPSLRGRGLSVPLMAAVTEHILRFVAPMASLYVNDFNHAARSTYEALGFQPAGTFSTVLM
ncbi:MAG: GNAT family N-acetyltransferase [Actinomycetales bacterium]|nr:GNAT family N-acetyltransferase [Actinomycetales bacterium]